jgi:hypothetical protein
MKSKIHEHKKNNFKIVSKTSKLLPLLLLFVLTSCSSVRVNYDYDKKVSFENYKSFAYNKTAIDKVEISDLDKKRILRSIDEVLITKGFTKSESPDLIISFFTKEREQVDVWNNNFGWGWGWGWGWGGPGFWGGGTSVTTNVEGVLYIDFIDAKTKELIWQGNGTGYLTENVDKKDEVIQEFVTKILAQYPPQKK